MSSYLFIESQYPSESADVQHNLQLATSLADRGHNVTIYFVQNGALCARRGVCNGNLQAARRAGVSLLADDFSLRERGIEAGSIDENVTASPIETVVDALAAGTKTIWH